MSKRKKKPSPDSIRKLERAQHKNEFLKKPNHLITLVSGPGVYELIPPQELDIFYKVRFLSVRIQAAKGQDIPAQTLKEMKHFLSNVLKREKATVSANGLQISCNDYFTIGITLAHHLSALKDTQFPAAPKLKDALQEFLRFYQSDQGYHKAYTNLYFTMRHIGMMYSDLNAHIYLLEQVPELDQNGKELLCLNLNVYAKETQRISVTMDGLTRPALRIGWGNNLPGANMDWVSINAADLDLEYKTEGLKFDVYIQSHALMRLAERIDRFLPGILHINIFDSLVQLKSYRINNGNYLFEYRIFQIKVGYLVGYISDGKIIIRTFLFLTNNGTPEGERLMENTGLLKEDKKFLIIDKLSTFLSSDIRLNQRVKQIFVDAGCESLFELYRLAPDKPEDIKEKSVSALIANYLGLEAPQ